MKTKALSISAAVLSASAAIAVNTALHPCRGEMAMKCSHTTAVGTVLLVILAVLSIASALTKKASVQRILGLLSMIGAAAVFFVPVLGHCGGAMMHCNSYTMPAFRIAGALLFVLILVSQAAGLFRKAQANAA